jgi:WD repeat-containing protein 23
VTRDQILRLLGHSGLRNMLTSRVGGQLFGADDSDDEEAASHMWRRNPRRKGAMEFEKVPSEEGQKLMASGTFGANERAVDSIQKKKKIASRLLRREMGLGSYGRQRARSSLLRQV